MMPTTIGNDFEYFDITTGENTVRHLIKDSEAREDISNLQNTIGTVPSGETVEGQIAENAQDILDLKSTFDNLGIEYDNLYDPSTAKEDIAIFSDGNEHNSPGNCCSDFIDISAYKSIIVFNTTIIVFYDKNKSKLSSYSDNTRTGRKAYDIQNACFVRITTKNDLINDVYVGNGLYDLANNKDKNVSILFVGNSLTVDAVSYVPYVLKELFPDVKFTFCIFANGGTTLSTQYDRFVNDTPAGQFSICDNIISWRTHWATHTMRYILSTYKFDIVCMQDYFNFRSDFTENDLEGWNNCQSFIESNYTQGNALQFVSLMPAPVRDNYITQEHLPTSDVFSITQKAMSLIMEKTTAQGIIPAGEGIYKALSTNLDALGDMQHLSSDGLHAQEGIPCLLQAYIVALWILYRFDLSRSVCASPIRITTAVYESLNVPGANLGTGVITGTDAQNILAQEIAISVIKEQSSAQQENESIQCDSVNLFNPNGQVEQGKIYFSDGSLHNAEGRSTTDFIPVEDLETIEVYKARNTLFFDSTKTFIPGSYRNETNTRNRLHDKISVPTNAVYIRVGADTADIQSLQVGKEISLNYPIKHDEFSIDGLRIYKEQIIEENPNMINDWFVTPEHFGAIGDGVTDDTYAFKIAQNANKPIMLGKKTYKANISITSDNVWICGSGLESIIIPADISKPVISINVDTSETTSDLIRNAILRDFKILGNGAVVGISLRCCQYCFLERLTIERCYTEGIRFRGVFDSKVTDCDLNICGNTGFLGDDDGLGNYAITIDATTGMNTNAIVFKGIRSEHTPRHLKLRNTQQMVFIGCKFETHSIAYASDPQLAPINAEGVVKGAIFTNCIIGYSGSLNDTSAPILFNNGNPCVYISLTDPTRSLSTVDGDEPYVLFSACQFRTQNNRASVYFNVNHTNFIGCTFNRCYGATDATEGNVLGKYSSVNDSNIIMAYGVRALKLSGTQVLVDKTRINVMQEDSNTSIISLDSTAQRGTVSVLYNGNDRSNLADGTIGIPVEFIGIRKYEPT